MRDKLHALDRALLDAAPVVVAYSGGVDSAFLLQRAHLALGHRCLGAIADSPSLARAELDAALDLARRIGAPVEVVRTGEFLDPDYLRNAPDRCYHCKRHLFTELEQLAAARGFRAIAYGENADDMADDRPGRRAASEFRVIAPLRDAGLTKAEVRAAARHAGLPAHDKPASPCLSSRIPHGTPVTRDALARVEQGEAALRRMGFRVFRLRHHGTRARIEFGPDDFGRYDDPATRDAVASAMAHAGYAEVERAPQPYGLPRAIAPVRTHAP